MSNTALAHARIADALAGLSRMFLERCKLTFVMRDPESPDGFMFISDDSEDEVIATLQRAKSQAPTALTPEQVLAEKLGLKMPEGK